MTKLKVGDIIRIKERGWKGQYLISAVDKDKRLYLRHISDNSFGTFSQDKVEKILTPKHVQEMEENKWQRNKRRIM